MKRKDTPAPHQFYFNKVALCLRIFVFLLFFAGSRRRTPSYLTPSAPWHLLAFKQTTFHAPASASVSASSSSSPVPLSPPLITLYMPRVQFSSFPYFIAVSKPRRTSFAEERQVSTRNWLSWLEGESRTEQTKGQPCRHLDACCVRTPPSCFINPARRGMHPVYCFSPFLSVPIPAPLAMHSRLCSHEKWRRCSFGFKRAFVAFSLFPSFSRLRVTSKVFSFFLPAAIAWNLESIPRFPQRGNGGDNIQFPQSCSY